MDKFLLVMAGDKVGEQLGKSNGFCSKSANIWQVVGYLLLVFKIVIPIILIILGMIDLGKAVVASKDDEIKKAMKSLMFRAIAAIAIFFIPTIVGIVMGLVSGFTSSVEEDFDICRKCITSPNDGTCKTAADEANRK